METKQIYFFIGTTAELIKLAPVIKELNRRKKSYKIITSGQNIVKFKELKKFIGQVSVYYAFKQRPERLHLPLLIGFIIWSMKAIVNYYLFFRHELRGDNKQNTYFVVHGDTVSSLLGSLIAKMFSMRLVHIESGLRSFNFFEPFPEEICRYIISRFADIHFCPNAWSVGNLKSVKGEKINTRQNTLIETFWSAMKFKNTSSILKRIRKKNKKYFVLVVHRQEHVLFGKAGTENVLEFIFKNAPPNLRCAFMLHDLSAPFISILRERMDNIFSNKVILTKLLPYGDFMHLLAGSEFVVTDGGSNQEELYYLGKPCLLIRKRTERTEGLETNVVLSKNNERIMKQFLKHYTNYRCSPIHPKTYPSRIISDHLLRRI